MVISINTLSGDSDFWYNAPIDSACGCGPDAQRCFKKETTVIMLTREGDPTELSPKPGSLWLRWLGDLAATLLLILLATPLALLGSVVVAWVGGGCW
jgi:hypothetical protein